MNKKELRAQLESLADPQYQTFSQNLLPGVSNILGVRIPYLRKIAKQAAKGEWRNLLREMDETFSMEETMIYGMILGYAKDIEWEEFLMQIVRFLPQIDNWCVCDTVCCSLKKVKEDREKFWDFVIPYLSSEKEFEVRFAAVMLLNFYIDEEWADKTIAVLMPLHPNGYYAKMGISWALSICWVLFPEKTKSLIEKSKASMDEEIYRKMIQKVIESTRTSKEEKKYLRMKRRKELTESGFPQNQELS